MKPLDQLAHLLSSDLTFRQAFLDNPDKAIAVQGLALDAEAKAALASVQGLLTLPPRELASRLFQSMNDYGSWGGFALDQGRPAPQPL